MDWTIKFTDIAIVIATFLGPIIAVRIQKHIERSRETNDRRLAIFRTLMTTRLMNLAPEHVQAINAIPLDFYGKGRKLKCIREHWATYMNHLSRKDMSTELWAKTRGELFVNMLYEMAEYLGYNIPKVELERDFYNPVAYETLENEQALIRKGMVQLLNGSSSISMNVLSVPENEEATAALVEIRNILRENHTT